MTLPQIILLTLAAIVLLALLLLLLAKGRSYEWALVGKYLRKRRIAWVSLIAVALCTTMVLVVISVMGGWLAMARTNFRGLSGDVIVQAGSLSGFPHYQEMIEKIQQLPEANSAVPVIQTFGLININNKKTVGVTVYGYPLDRIGQVNAFPQSLWRQYNQWVEWADGAPISANDRRTLRELYKLDVREGEPLLKLTREERDRLRGVLTKAQQTSSDARNQLSKPGGPPPEEQYKELLEKSALGPVVRRLLDGEEPSAPDRQLIREHLDNDLVTDPDELLAPNEAERNLARQQAQKMIKSASFDLFLPEGDYKEAFRRANPKARQILIDEAATWNGMIAGTGVVNIRRNREGKFEGRGDFLYELPVKLTVLGVSPSGEFKVESRAERPYWIVDTSRTKVWQFDSNTVYVPFQVLQTDLGMQEQDAELDGKAVKIPARTSEIHISIKPPHNLNSLALDAARAKIEKVVDEILDAHNYSGPEPVAKTWEQSQAKWLGAIEKEMILVTFLFGIISVVAIFLIFCIFYMIVVEKTKDIGIIKSVGATSRGVAGIFIGYGAAIGVVGAGLGLLLGYLIVHNINTLHDWMGRVMNVQVWDPEVYAFDTIPNTLNPVHVAWICGAAILSSILGALVPAIRAARMHPVEALRWE